LRRRFPCFRPCSRDLRRRFPWFRPSSRDLDRRSPCLLPSGGAVPAVFTSWSSFHPEHPGSDTHLTSFDAGPIFAYFFLTLRLDFFSPAW
jgi:hypothetical protein